MMSAVCVAAAADLPALFLVGQVTVAPVGTELAAVVELADGGKCERCWTVRALGGNAAHPTLCDRCAAVVA